MKRVRFKTGWLYHPITIFLSIQILWILLMVAWIRWYIEKHTQLRAMAQRLRTQVEVEGWGWLPLLEGAVLLTLILAGATVIFIYYLKQRRLNQMQRAFVSNVTHELKSPVASIQLALETMALRDLSIDRRREFVSMMLDDTERLSTLIDRILGAARIEKSRDRYQLEPVSMRRFVEEVLEEDRHLYEKDGRTIILETGRDARVAIDRSAMRVVLANLLENASRYSPKNENSHPTAQGSEQLPAGCPRQRQWDSGQGSQECFQNVLERVRRTGIPCARNRFGSLYCAEHRERS